MNDGYLTLVEVANPKLEVRSFVGILLSFHLHSFFAAVSSNRLDLTPHGRARSTSSNAAMNMRSPADVRGDGMDVDTVGTPRTVDIELFFCSNFVKPRYCVTFDVKH